MYRTLLHDSTSPAQPEVDERVAKAMIELDDPEVMTSESVMVTPNLVFLSFLGGVTDLS